MVRLHEPDKDIRAFFAHPYWLFSQIATKSHKNSFHNAKILYGYFSSQYTQSQAIIKIPHATFPVKKKHLNIGHYS